MMTRTKHDHAPDPEFIDGLEWQLQRELSRRTSFTPPRARRAHRGPRLAGLAALVVVSGLLGAAGLSTAQQAQESRRAEPMIQALEARATAAATLHGLAVSSLGDVESLHERGFASNAEVRSAQLRVSEAETRASRFALDLEEARRSGRAPRDEPSAPLVAGRDFVSERLELDRRAAERVLAPLREQLEHETTLHEAGFVSGPELARARQAVTIAELHVRELSALLDARARYIVGDMSAAAVERAALRTRAAFQADRIAARLVDLRAAWERTNQLHERGFASAGELREARGRLAVLEIELEAARMELAALSEE